MFLSFKYLIFISYIINSISCEVQSQLSKEISCARRHRWINFKLLGNKFWTCRIEEKIDSKGFEFSNEDVLDELVHAISFSGNSEISYLPDKVYEKFPKILMFDAKNCKISTIEKSNFEKLFNLTAVDLSQNLISYVPLDVFEDSQNLQVINMSKFYSI